MSEPLLDSEEAAELLHVKVSWMREATRSGLLPCLRVGRQVRYTRPMLEAWLAKQYAGGRHALIAISKCREVKVMAHEPSSGTRRDADEGPVPLGTGKRDANGNAAGAPSRAGERRPYSSPAAGDFTPERMLRPPLGDAPDRLAALPRHRGSAQPGSGARGVAQAR